MYLTMGATYASSPLAKSDYPLLTVKDPYLRKNKDDVIFINPVNDP